MVVFFVCGMLVILPEYRRNESFFGDGIVTRLAKWIASEDSPSGEEDSNEKSSLFKRFDSIFGAGWSKSACRWENG